MTSINYLKPETFQRPEFNESPNLCMIQRLFDARKRGFVMPAAHMIAPFFVLHTANSGSSGGAKAPGRLLAIDLGAKRVGVAVCDELRMTVRPVTTLPRRSWKELLREVRQNLADFEAQGLVIGLPLNFDGSEGPAAAAAREIASKFRRSLSIPVYLQDERLTTEEAKLRRKITGKTKLDQRIDSEAAAIILQDFLSLKQP